MKPEALESRLKALEKQVESQAERLQLLDDFPLPLQAPGDRPGDF